MTVAERMLTIRLLEKMNEHKEVCKKIGLEDFSVYKEKV